MYVCPPHSCTPFCRSHDHVYISVPLVIDIPDLLFTLLWHCSSRLRQLGLMCSRRHHPPTGAFPRVATLAESASGHENEITFIAAARECHHRTGRSPPPSPLYRRARWGWGGGSCCDRVPPGVGYPDRTRCSRTVIRVISFDRLDNEWASKLRIDSSVEAKWPGGQCR